MKILKNKRKIAYTLLVVLAIQWAYPTTLFALTGGPSQPEMQGFQQAGANDMVDLFTGDFSYNIPLFELPGPNGGYPFNLSYQAGISMDQEASWTGLGFSLNPGAVTRQMRGLPDEFAGDTVTTKMSVTPSYTVGMSAGAGVEFFGTSAAGLSLSQGFGVSMNSYTGLSYSIDNSIGFRRTTSSGSTANIGISVGVDSKEGVNVSPYAGLGKLTGEIGLRVGYNSKSGLNTISASASTSKWEGRGFKKDKNAGAFSLASASLSLAHPGYTPQISMPMKNLSFSASFKIGGGWDGIHPNGYAQGFYNEQRLAYDMQTVKTPAYGYQNAHKATGDNDLMDINREKDGMVSQSNPNLAIPSHAFDIYSAAGQGFSAMYRAFRNDMGILHDQQMQSVSLDAGGGVDIGIPLHVGGNLSLNHATTTSGKWSDNNEVTSKQFFISHSVDKTDEPWEMKVHGESTNENASVFQSIGNDNAVRVRLDQNSVGDVVTAKATFETNSTSSAIPLSSSGVVRKTRANVVQTITNGELLNGSAEVLPLFKIKYYDATKTIHTYSRTSHPAHHPAGITALTPAGMRYIYALPIYNTIHEEVSYTANKPLNVAVNRVRTGNNGASTTDPQFDYAGTEKFLKKTNIAPYAHSYLLTSIVGPDYVDITNDGVTADDQGYWVNFTYQQINSATDPYKWREPFSQAYFQEGWKTDPRDDKGAYTYGEKELWYLAKAETRSHIAEFKITKRLDGYGVAQRLQDTNLVGKPMYALSEIDLYSRSARNNYKIKVVRFEYDYSLCQNIPNFKDPSGAIHPGNMGKLTLKKLWFEYGGTKRGKLNPYTFSYHPSNPDYSSYAFDRWGNYRSYPSDNPLQNIDAPYTLQDPALKSTIDANSASWSLSQIKLPSGGTILVDYESDDYAYVQNQPAAQMMNPVDPYSSTSSLSSNYLLKDSDLKIRFKLKKPISGMLNSTEQRVEVLKYIDQQRKQLPFKLKVNVRSQGEDFYEYVNGYATIDMAGQMGLETSGGGPYQYGYFQVSKEDGYHPFSARVWQHLRTNQPELANSGERLTAASSNSDRIGQIKGLGSLITQVKEMFTGFKTYCSKHNWGREVVANESWIRLVTPDQTKFGGGIRVKQVTIKDNFANDDQGVYGQRYEYSTTDEANNIISSGVAAYEPIVGGEENSLRYAKTYVDAIPLRSDNNLFFEYPINESYYPSPLVGYSKVTVRSLASASRGGVQLKDVNRFSDSTKLVFPSAPFGTSGVTISEFYTAKDFPVITDETEKVNKPFKYSFAIPFLGSISESKLTTSQGYSVITNDMHGKQKRVSTFRLDRQGNTESDAISWVQYNYRCDTVNSAAGKYFVVGKTNLFVDGGNNALRVATKAEVNNAAIKKYSVGQETEIFTDMRETADKALGGGANGNVDGIFILFGVIPIPTIFPNVSKSSVLLRTAVTNKIIFKSGILETTEAYNEGSLITTKNIKWDKTTGGAILTSVNNNFDNQVYSFAVPAYQKYPNMGPASQNVGLAFNISDVRPLPYYTNRYQFKLNISPSLLCPGDELLIYSSSALINPIVRAIYEGQEDKTMTFYANTSLTSSNYVAKIIRSGFRNQVTVNTETITALDDPSLPPATTNTTRTIVSPRLNFQ